MAFVTSPNHEVTLVQSLDGVEVHSSGQKLMTILNSNGKVQLAVVSDPAAAGVAVETSGPSIGKVLIV